MVRPDSPSPIFSFFTCASEGRAQSAHQAYYTRFHKNVARRAKRGININFLLNSPIQRCLMSWRPPNSFLDLSTQLFKPSEEALSGLAH